MVFQAGLIAFFRTILIFVLIFYGVRLILRFLLPWIFKTILNKQFSNFSQQAGRDASANSAGQQSTKKKPRKDNLGEYVEYEEIDENE